MPRVLQALVRRLVRWGVLPAAKAPDSAIINIYEPEDCIPPHIDHHDFTRPFCTLRRAADISRTYAILKVPKEKVPHLGVMLRTLSNPAVYQRASAALHYRLDSRHVLIPCVLGAAAC